MVASDNHSLHFLNCVLFYPSLIGSDQAKEWTPGPQPKSTTEHLEMELESGVGGRPKSRSNTIRTSTPGKTQIYQIDYSAQSVMVAGEDTTASECTELNKTGFIEDMEVETEEASDQMVRKNVSI